MVVKEEEKKKKERFESSLNFALKKAGEGKLNSRRLRELAEASGDYERFMKIFHEKTHNRFVKTRKGFDVRKKNEEDRRYLEKRGIKIPEGVNPSTYKQNLLAEQKLKEEGVPIKGVKPATALKEWYIKKHLKEFYGVDVPKGATAEAIKKRFEEGVRAVANLIGLMEEGYTEEEAMKIYVSGRGRDFKKSRRKEYLEKAKEILEKSKTIPKPEKDYLKRKQRKR